MRTPPSTYALHVLLFISSFNLAVDARCSHERCPVSWLSGCLERVSQTFLTSVHYTMEGCSGSSESLKKCKSVDPGLPPVLCNREAWNSATQCYTDCPLQGHISYGGTEYSFCLSGNTFSPDVPSQHLRAGEYPEGAPLDVVLLHDTACNVSQFSGLDLRGKAVVLFRGGCYFYTKMVELQKAGAVAALMVDTNTGNDMFESFFLMSGSSDNFTLVSTSVMNQFAEPLVRILEHQGGASTLRLSADCSRKSNTSFMPDVCPGPSAGLRGACEEVCSVCQYNLTVEGRTLCLHGNFLLPYKPELWYSTPTSSDLLLVPAGCGGLPPGVAGKTVVFRGSDGDVFSCTRRWMVQLAQDAGAAGVIFAWNGHSTSALKTEGPSWNLSIPVSQTLWEDSLALLALLDSGGAVPSTIAPNEVRNLTVAAIPDTPSPPAVKRLYKKQEEAFEVTPLVVVMMVLTGLLVVCIVGICWWQMKAYRRIAHTRKVTTLSLVFGTLSLVLILTVALTGSVVSYSAGEGARVIAMESGEEVLASSREMALKNVDDMASTVTAWAAAHFTHTWLDGLKEGHEVAVQVARIFSTINSGTWRERYPAFATVAQKVPRVRVTMMDGRYLQGGEQGWADSKGFDSGVMVYRDYDMNRNILMPLVEIGRDVWDPHGGDWAPNSTRVQRLSKMPFGSHTLSAIDPDAIEESLQLPLLGGESTGSYAQFFAQIIVAPIIDPDGRFIGWVRVDYNAAFDFAERVYNHELSKVESAGRKQEIDRAVVRRDGAIMADSHSWTFFMCDEVWEGATYSSIMRRATIDTTNNELIAALRAHLLKTEGVELTSVPYDIRGTFDIADYAAALNLSRLILAHISFEDGRIEDSSGRWELSTRASAVVSQETARFGKGIGVFNGSGIFFDRTLMMSDISGRTYFTPGANGIATFKGFEGRKGLFSNNDFTVAFWVHPTREDCVPLFTDNHSNGIVVRQDGVLHIGENGYYCDLNVSKLTVGAWTHLAVVVKWMGYCAVYVNGGFATAGGMYALRPHTDSTQTTIAIGEGFYGYMDEIWAVQHALSPMSVMMLYLANRVSNLNPPQRYLYEVRTLNNTVDVGDDNYLMVIFSNRSNYIDPFEEDFTVSKLNLAIQNHNTKVQLRQDSGEALFILSVVGLVAILTFLIANAIIIMPLRELVRAMVPLQAMEIEEAEKHLLNARGVMCKVAEVNALVNGYTKALEALKTYRRYLPPAVLLDDDEALSRELTTVPTDPFDYHEDNLSGLEDCSVYDSPCNSRRGSLASSQPPMATTPSNRAGNGLNRTELRLERLNDQKTFLRKRRASILLTEIDLGNDASQIMELSDIVGCFASFVLSTADRRDGVSLHISAGTVLVSWNTHRLCPDHVLTASRCAIELSAIEQKVARGRWWSAAVTSGTLYVGHCGTKSNRAPVALGEPLVLASALVKLSRRVACHILVSEQVRKQIATALPTRVVDAVPSRPDADCPSDSVSLVYELMQSESKMPPSAYIEAFGALRQLRLAACKAKLVDCLKAVPTDAQALRLLKIALRFEQTGRVRSGGYTRAVLGCWEDLEGQAKGVPLPNELLGTEIQLRWDRSGKSPLLGLAHINSGGSTPRKPRPPSVADAEALRRRLQEAKEEYMKLHEDEPKSPLRRSPLRTPSRRVPFGGSDTDSSPSTPRSDGTSSTPRAGGGLGRRRIQSCATASSASSHSVLTSSEDDGDPPRVFTTGEGSRKRQWNRSNKLLGTGAYGQVWLGMGDDGSLVALKAVPHRKGGLAVQQAENLVREVAMLHSLRHDNIVSYFGSTVSGRHVLIAMEYLAGGCLADLLSEFGTIQVSAIQRYVGDILRGLAFLHGSNPAVVHCDLKPANVLLTIEGECKLVDFGSAGALSRAGPITGTGFGNGTPLYMSPEAAGGAVPSPATDIWSLGILVCELFTGWPPYPIEQASFNPIAFVRQLARDASFRPKIPPGLSPEANAFIRSCLKPNATDRPGAEDLLCSPFLLNSSIDPSNRRSSIAIEAPSPRAFIRPSHITIPQCDSDDEESLEIEDTGRYP